MENNKPLRVLFITRAYKQNAGGMERLSYEFIDNLSRVEGVESRVIAYSGPRWASPLFLIPAFSRAIFIAPKVDVIHLGDPLLSKLGWSLKLFFRKPIAMTVHGLDLSYPNFIYQLYLRLNAINFDLYLPISLATKQLLEKFNVKGKISVLHPGITDRLYNPNFSRTDLARVLKQDIKDKVVLLTVGRLVKRKGHAWFIQNVLPKLLSNTIYVIAGDGPEADNIRALNNSQVLMLGRVSDEDVAVLYNTVDAFVQPNVPVAGDIEGFGLVLLEAALCQRHVFASDLEGMKDAIVAGENGTLIPTQNAAAWIEALNNFIAAKNTVNIQAREYTLRNFSWDKQAGLAVELLRDISKK